MTSNRVLMENQPRRLLLEAHHLQLWQGGWRLRLSTPLRALLYPEHFGIVDRLLHVA